MSSVVIQFGQSPVKSLPFQQSTFGEELHGSYPLLPINVISDSNLHYADIAYVVGFVVAAVIYWLGSRMMPVRSTEPM